MGSQEGSKAKESVWNQPEKFNRLLGQMDQGFRNSTEAVKVVMYR
ncbi:hypothetical protein [Vibrio cyclitrophicus]|nr:hypothetical protein [Vibrio cyclitrophicus]